MPNDLKEQNDFVAVFFCAIIVLLVLSGCQSGRMIIADTKGGIVMYDARASGRPNLTATNARAHFYYRCGNYVVDCNGVRWRIDDGYGEDGNWLNISADQDGAIKSIESAAAAIPGVDDRGWEGRYTFQVQITTWIKSEDVCQAIAALGAAQGCRP